MKILICPYCMTQKSEDSPGCCGESNAHFQELSIEFQDSSERVNITIPKKLKALARLFDLNISEVTRKALREEIKNRQESSKT